MSGNLEHCLVIEVYIGSNVYTSPGVHLAATYFKKISELLKDLISKNVDLNATRHFFFQPEFSDILPRTPPPPKKKLYNQAQE